MRRFRLTLRRGVSRTAPSVKADPGQAVSEAQLFQALGSSFPAYYVAISLEGRVLSMNPVMLEALGYRLDEVLGREYVASFVPEADRASLRGLFVALLETGKTVNENRILTRDGRSLWCEWHGTAVPREGRIAYLFGLGIDITERKLAEDARLRTEANLRTVLDTIPDLVWLKNPAGQYLECNRKFERLYGVTREALLGRTDHDFVDAQLADIYTANDQITLAADRPTTYEEEVTYADDGHFELLESIKTPVRDHLGNLLGVLGIGRDITGRKRTETDLQRSRAGLAALIESTRDLIWSVDRQYRLTAFNSVLDEHFRKNYGTYAYLGAGPWELIPPDRAVTWSGRYERAMTEGPYQSDLELPDGRTLELAFHPIHLGEAVEGVSVFGKDVTQLRRFLLALEASERRYREIVDNAPIGIFRCDLGGRCLIVNRGLLEQFECADPEAFERDYGRAEQRWVRPGQHEEYRARLRADRVVQGFEAETRLQSGKAKWFLLFSFLDETDPQFCNGFSVDITSSRLAEQERTRILEQLHHSQKMDAIGQLAGGVAHDFNNLLGGIIGAVDHLKSARATVTEEKREAYLDLILKAAVRAGDLNGKLLAFARTGQKAFTVVDVRKVLADTLAILRSTLDKRIAITIEDRTEAAVVIGDDALLASVFLNMGINACHAMPRGGSLVFSLGRVELDPAFCAASPFDLAPGSHLEVEIRDTGSGMTPEVQARIFEPFFTTKPEGQGTGLGLAAAYGTILDHRGAIQVESEVGVGTTFRILLPQAAGEVPEAAPVAEAVGGTGTILVVDDEEFMRFITESMLEELGYTVLLAANGSEAVELFRRGHGEIDLVILDLIMPVMGGRQALELMHGIDASVPVVLSSGLDLDETLEEMKSLGASGFLRKPCRLPEVSQVVSALVMARRK